MVFREKNKGFDVRKVRGRDSKIFAKWWNSLLNLDLNRFRANIDTNWVYVLTCLPIILPLLFLPLLIFVMFICLSDGLCEEMGVPY